MRETINFQIVEELNKHKEIIFGPFIGEYGWEICRWAGFIRWYSKQYNKKIIISTRSDRKELYNGINAEFDLFEIQDDYEYLSPNCYGSNMSKETYSNLINGVRKKYPKAYIFHPTDYKCNRNIFSVEQMDYAFESTHISKSIIDQLCKKIDPNQNKKIICLASRHRTDNNARNWGIKNWLTLMDLLENSKKYIVFVLGISPSYIKPTNKHHYFIDLEKYVSEELSTTHTGLTIAAIQKANLTVGVQTGNIILSNLLKTPTLFWGHEIERHAVFENPLKTRSHGIYNPSYDMSPIGVLSNIKNMLG